MEIWLKLMKMGARLGCHQRPDRSFFYKGYQFPVCARCTGLFVGYFVGIAIFMLCHISYQALKSQLGLRAGDVLYICSLDRLSRNKNDLKNEIRWFQEHDIRLMILDLPTSMIQVPKGQEWVIQMVENVLIEVLASIAENERNTIRQRQREGIEAAQMKGKHLGRPKLKVPDDFPMVYRQWRENNITAKEAMRRLEMSPSSFYRVVKKYEWEG